MDIILTNHQISGSIIDLIEETREHCFLVTPYYKPWNLLDRALEKAANKEKRLVFIFRANEIHEQHLHRLNGELGFDIYLVNRLHTKLYLNENRVILSSMNLYDNSKENNYEVGYSIDTMKTSKKFLETVIWGDILSLKPELHLEGFYSVYQKEVDRKKNLEKEKKIFEPKEIYEIKNNNMSGYCIRCRRTINLNPDAPLCNSCYNSWSYYGNPDFEENYCHICGRQIRSSMNKPLCYECYRNEYKTNAMNKHRF